MNHNTVIRWVRETGKKLMRQINNYQIPLVAQLDEIQTFIGRKTKKVWLWTSVDKDKSEILEGILGDRSSETLPKLWQKIKHWNCYFWITDGYKVYPNFLPDGDQIISKISLTRVEGENSRLRHYLARLHRKTFCYSQSFEMLYLSVQLLIYYLKNKNLSNIIF